jgi:hypothetical protein
MWQQIATGLLKKYCERFYAYKRSAAEAPHLKYVELNADDENFIQGDQYIVRLDAENAAFQRQLEDVRATITRLRETSKSGDFSGITLGTFAADFKPLFIGEHLYHPLIYAKGVEMTPVALNAGELQFVEDLRDFYHAEKSGLFAGMELYLLRNRARGRGIGFFEAGNFYPDFVIWVLTAGKQHILFVDPKGIIHEFSLESPKLQLYKVIKEKEKSMGNSDIVLDSFILSRTLFKDVSWLGAGTTKAAVEQRHVLFLEDGGPAYLRKLFTQVFTA